MKTNRIRKVFVIAGGVFAAMLVSAQAAFAQGCALCYNDAAATGPQGIEALRHGILILAIPPMLIFAALFAVLYKRRNLHHEFSAPASGAAVASSHSMSEFVLHLN
ncbi:MAG TPA: hypothetical protein VFU57_10855 [Candidatus Acidoferrales bacterium]|nr:hypothetical protein [Candidatus Acidoferrales bacterium]